MERKPPWFNVGTIPVGDMASRTMGIIAARGLNTVCTSAACPNRGTCFGEDTATFLILGNACSRSCKFCNIKGGTPEPVDPTEPDRVAEAAAEMGLRFVVITSVTRDDLQDEGSGAFAETVRAVKDKIEGVRVEVLVPDFNGKRELLANVLSAGPDVFNHNLETVERLTPEVRSKASYIKSLEVLKLAGELKPGIPTKSGLMVGLGEKPDELRRAFTDLVAAGVTRLTIGQYLRPSMKHLPVVKYYTPNEFDSLAREARKAGIMGVLAGPLVRSSFHASVFSEAAGDDTKNSDRGDE